MSIIVKEVVAEEEKSSQQREAELLQKHEEQQAAAEAAKVEKVEVEVNAEGDAPAELKEEDVLSFIKSKYNKEAASIDELLTVQKEIVKEQLPEDVEAYYKYKQETGRGFDDFVRLNKNFDKVSENELLAEYYREVEDADEEEVNYLLSSKFGYDEDLDDEAEVKGKSIAKKKEIRKAKKYFEEQKEKYKMPIEQKASVSKEDQEVISKYNEYVASQTSKSEKTAKQAQIFQSKTDEVFGNEFKGFEFSINDKNIPFLPGDASEVKSTQLNIDNFIGKYFDNEGTIKDAKGYHKALAAAMNPDKMAAHFYEQGRLDAIESSNKGAKNIDMSVKSTPQTINKDGFAVREVNPAEGKGLKIRFKN